MSQKNKGLVLRKRFRRFFTPFTLYSQYILFSRTKFENNRKVSGYLTEYFSEY